MAIFQIYDGPDSNAPLLDMICGSEIQRTYFSTSNTMYIYFYTDTSIVRAGFTMTYIAILGTDQTYGKVLDSVLLFIVFNVENI